MFFLLYCVLVLVKETLLFSNQPVPSIGGTLDEPVNSKLRKNSVSRNKRVEEVCVCMQRLSARVFANVYSQ